MPVKPKITARPKTSVDFGRTSLPTVNSHNRLKTHEVQKSRVLESLPQTDDLLSVSSNHTKSPTIVATDHSSENSWKQNFTTSESDSFAGTLNVVTEQSTKRAITPPPKPPPPRSVHSDMYDTLFALQSLQGDDKSQGSTVNDYLKRVRTLWDGQYRSEGVHSLSQGQTGSDLNYQNNSQFIRSKTRASSESRILDTRSEMSASGIDVTRACDTMLEGDFNANDVITQRDNFSQFKKPTKGTIWSLTAR